MITEMITSLNSQIHIWLDEPTYISSIGSPFSSDIFKLLPRFGPELHHFGMIEDLKSCVKLVRRNLLQLVSSER